MPTDSVPEELVEQGLFEDSLAKPFVLGFRASSGKTYFVACRQLPFDYLTLLNWYFLRTVISTSSFVDRHCGLK